MSEVRRLNDARRGRFCRPGAERDDLVICDLGTPWCPVDHDEDLEVIMLAMIASGASAQLTDALAEMERRSCVVKRIVCVPAGWEMIYLDRWGSRGAIHVGTTPNSAVVLQAHRDQLEKELRKPQEFSGADLMAALSIVGFMMAAMISIVWVASLL